MSDFKGTKGPWVVGKSGGTVVSTDLRQVTRQDKSSGHGDSSYYGGLLVCESVRTKADVILISKAPEMLEMLEKCLELCESLNPKSRISNEVRKLIKEATEL